MLGGMFPRSLPVALVLACLTQPLPASSGDPFDLARPAIRTYGMTDGLPSATVYCFAQDTKRRLWAGTVDGAARLTGAGWVPLPMPRDCPSRYIRSILASRDDSLWFATQDGGLWRLQADSWTSFRGGRELPSDHVFSLAEQVDAQGRLWRWAGFDAGVAALVDGQWRTWGTADGFPRGTVWRLREITEPDGRKRMWAATEGGMAVFEGDRWRTLGRAEGFPEGGTNDMVEAQEPDGRRVVWVSLWNRGIARWDGRQWTLHASGKEFPSRFPTSSLGLTRDAQGRATLWSGTLNEGLWAFQGTRWQPVSRDRMLAATGILASFPIPGGKPTLWIGSRGEGVISLDQGGWRTLDPSHGLPGPEVTCFLQVPAAGGRDTWIGTSTGLVRFPAGGGAPEVATGLPSRYVIALLGDERELWAATLQGLYVRRQGQWSRETGAGAIPEGMVISLHQSRGRDGQATLWVGTPAGLATRKAGRWQLLTRRDGLPHDYIATLVTEEVPGSDPVLWVGTRGGGLACLRDGRWHTYGAEAGLPNGTLYALHVDRDPRGRTWIWAGTLGGGLARLDVQGSGRWKVYDQARLPGLASNYIQRIERDRQGRLYLSTATGVSRIHLALRDDLPEPVKVETFTLGDGLPSPNGSLGASMVDHAGRIWIGTSRGAAILDPSLETFPPEPPMPVLERATAGGRPLSRGERIGHRQDHIRFEFALPIFHRREDTRYQTQLLGLEGKPQPWQAEGWREFPTLPAGHYTLRVWARTYDGTQAGPVDFPFQVNPAPWAHPLALGGYALAGLLGVAAFVAWRTRRLRKRTLDLERAVHERTRVIEDQALALETSNQELQGSNSALKATIAHNEQLIGDLSAALAEVKTLQGLIPICAYCKKIRDDHGLWEQIEHYLAHHSQAQFSHGICPDCRREHFPEVGPPRT